MKTDRAAKMSAAVRWTLVFTLVSLWGDEAAAEERRPTWVVQPGDALSLIAEQFDVRVTDIKAWNGLDSDLIRIGQKLYVGPTGSAAKRTARARNAVSTTPAASHGRSISTTTTRQRSRSRHSTVSEIDWTPPFEFEEPRKAPKPERTVLASTSTRPPVLPRRTRYKGRRTYRIRSGDTLTSVAKHFKTTVPALVEANPGIHPDRLFPGQTISVGEPRSAVRYIVERGDTISKIAARHKVTSRQLVAWNPTLRRGKLTRRSTLRIFASKAASRSESIGAVNSGRLRRPVQLPSHKAYVRRAPERAFGTEETVRWMVDAFDAVRRRYGTRKRVRVHDISDWNGGRLRRHKSHQSGRDADISYYQTSCSKGVCPFKSFRPRKLDVKRQWTLLRHWLVRDQAELIFIDYKLQAPLYRYARRRGATKAQLARWFQYPRGRNAPTGIIRHYRSHSDHLHVRFVCPYSDDECR